MYKNLVEYRDFYTQKFACSRICRKTEQSLILNFVGLTTQIIFATLLYSPLSHWHLSF